MKKILSLSLAIAFSLLAVNAQRPVSKFVIDGFEVVIIPAASFSYKHDGSRRVVETNENGTLTLRVEDGDPRNETKVPLTIYANKIDHIKLDRSNLTYDDEALGKFSEWNLDLNSHSNVNLMHVKANKVKAYNSSGAILNISGNVAEVEVKLDAASFFNSTDLTVETMKLDIASASKADLKMDVQDLIINGKYGVEVKLEGTAKMFTLNGNMAVRVLAEEMLMNEASITIQRGCEITLNAAKMNENPEVKNVHANFKSDKRKFPF